VSFFKHDKALVHPNAKVGEATRVWAFANILEGAIIGRGCNVCDGCFVEKGAIVGNNCTIKNNVALFDGVTLEDDVFVGANTTFINDRIPRANQQDDWTLEKVTVKKGATLGANSTILCGVTIGEYAFVGAGSVVTKDVPAYALVYGNPAKVQGKVDKSGQKAE